MITFLDIQFTHRDILKKYCLQKVKGVFSIFENIDNIEKLTIFFIFLFLAILLLFTLQVELSNGVFLS